MLEVKVLSQLKAIKYLEHGTERPRERERHIFFAVFFTDNFIAKSYWKYCKRTSMIKQAARSAAWKFRQRNCMLPAKT